jgi:VIT1/CCC1 family predicted Fe2+/Mn2+ transporter
MLAPTEQVALILGGRKPPHPSEDLLLRARLDLEEGRTRQAALQAHAASEALLAELRAEGAEQVAERLAPGSEPLATLAGVARERPLDAEEAEELDQRVTEMERVARRRRHL